MVNQGTHRITVAELRRRNETLVTELAARDAIVQQLRDQLAAREPTGWRSWRWAGQVPAIMTALAAVAALFYTAQGLADTEAATSRQNALAQSGQITDRFNAAVTNLGSTTMTIRLGGIYALQRIMTDSASDQPAVLQLLTTFIRTTPEPATQTPSVSSSIPTGDVQAALTVVLHRDPSHDGPARLDLDDADLAGADLSSGTLSNVDLDGANLSGAILQSMNLTDTGLESANLANVDLKDTNFTNTDLKGTNLSSAFLDYANFTRAFLGDANLAHAQLQYANLTGADLQYAHLTDVDPSFADFSDANLTNAHLDNADLTSTHLKGAKLGGTSLCAGTKPTKPDFGYRCSAAGP